jgi:preprotein translocase subunit YajC
MHTVISKFFLVVQKTAALISLVLLSSLAMAEGAPVAPEGPSAMIQLVFFGGFILVFYFLMWRPQSKRAKEHKNLVEALNKGDEVVTNGGIAGKINKVSEEFVLVEISQGVEMKVQKQAIAAALPKGTLKSI